MEGFEFKKGKGNASNSSSWFCAKKDGGPCMAAVSFSSYQGSFLSLWYIDEKVFDKCGTFLFDDYKSEKLIKKGELAFRSENGTHWAPPMPDVINDPDYRERFAWFFERWYER